MCVERSGGLILGIDDNAGDGQHRTGLHDFRAGVGQQN